MIPSRGNALSADDDTLITPGGGARQRVTEAITRLPIYLTPEEAARANCGRSIRLSEEQAREVADRALAELLEEEGLNVHSWLNKVNQEWLVRAYRAEAALRKERAEKTSLVNLWRTLAGCVLSVGFQQTLRYQYHFAHFTAVLTVLPLLTLVGYLCIKDLYRVRRHP